MKAPSLLLIATLVSGTFHFDFAVAAPVPDPATSAMLPGGLLMLGMVAARRAR